MNKSVLVIDILTVEGRELRRGAISIAAPNVGDFVALRDGCESASWEVVRRRFSWDEDTFLADRIYRTATTRVELVVRPSPSFVAGE